MRILIAGLVGGVAMFIWAAVGHDVLPLGSLGLKALPNEAAAIATIQASTGGKSGLYYFPAAQMSTKPPAGPSGLLAYYAGSTAMTPATLGLELGSEIIQALLLALVMSALAVTAFWRRVRIAGVVGVAAAMTTSASYWIWYHFPTDYTLGYMFVDAVRYVVAGVVIAWILKPKAAA